MFKDLFEWLGFRVVWTTSTDSSAARAMAYREGVGRIHHMDVRVWWTQRAVKFLNLTIKKIDGKKNCADLGTKSHSAGEHKRLCEMNYWMSEEDVRRPPTAEVNAVTPSGGASIRTA